MTFYISPRIPSPFYADSYSTIIEVESYKNALIKAWIHIVFHEPISQYVALQWTLPDVDEEIGTFGTLMKSSCMVALDYGANFVEFVLWHRAYVPQTQKLVLYHEGSETGLELTETTTAEQIKKIVGVSD